MQIFAKIDDVHTIWVQHLAGPALCDVVYLDQFEDFLQCHQQVILLPIMESNYRVDIVRQLIAQKNYLIFVSIHYPEFRHWGDLIIDCPEAAQFPIVMSSKNSNHNSFGANSFYFYTITESNVLKAKDYTIDEIFSDVPKPHTFLFLNGADRPHRFLLWHALNNQGLLDKSLWSWLGYRKSQHEIELYPDNPESIPITLLPKHYESAYWDLDRIPLYQQDVRNHTLFKTKMAHGHWTEGHVVPQQYIDTYFTLVSESSCTPGEIFVTEKTYKPIMAGHPFITLNSTGTYEYLREELGLQTFGHVIDESFDREPDLNRRIAMIAEQVRRVVQGNLQEFLKLVEPQCRHNQDHYIDNRYNYYRQQHLKFCKWLDEHLMLAQQYTSGSQMTLKSDYHV